MPEAWTYPGINTMQRRFVCFLLAIFFVSRSLAAGYSPSDADSKEIQRLSSTYFQLVDKGDYATAYAMQTAGMQAAMPFHEWLSLVRQTPARLGKLEERAQAKITWYLNPPNSPGPGLYVAVDYQSRYTNTKQHTEYLVWLRVPGESNFKLARHEATFLLKNVSKTDAEILKRDGAIPISPAPDETPLEESESNAIGYPTVNSARNALSNRNGVKVRPMQDGWLVVEDPSENAVWSFAPPGHPAYPAVVKRFTTENDGAVMLNMTALCQAEKKPCDALIRQFQEMNDRIMEEAKSK